MPSWRTMSRATRRVAVAVSASTGRRRLRLEPAQLAVGRPEVVAPVADAVRLVDDDQSDRAVGEERAQRAPERLGRDVQQLELAARSSRMRVARSSPSSVELSTAARKPSRSSASTWSFISEISGEITSTVPPQQLGRHLKGQRLAGAGRHDADAVAAGEHGVDDLALPGPEASVAEDGLEHLLADRPRSAARPALRAVNDTRGGG